MCRHYACKKDIVIPTLTLSSAKGKGRNPYRRHAASREPAHEITDGKIELTVTQ